MGVSWESCLGRGKVKLLMSRVTPASGIINDHQARRFDHLYLGSRTHHQKVPLGSESSHLRVCLRTHRYDSRSAEDAVFNLIDEHVACVPKVLCHSITRGCFRGIMALL